MNNVPVEQMFNCKFLVTTVTSDLTWSVNYCSQILNQAKQRMYFLRQLKSYNVNPKIHALLNFYSSIIESILISSITAWLDPARPL